MASSMDVVEEGVVEATFLVLLLPVPLFSLGDSLCSTLYFS